MKRDRIRPRRNRTGMIVLKTDEELRLMRESGRLAAAVLRTVVDAVAPGVSTADLAAMADEAIRGYGAESAFFGYCGYPGVICVSVNEMVVHGVPGNRRILPGDIVSLDVGVRYGGYIGDNAVTVPVGVTDPRVLDLVDTARQALDAGIAECRPGGRLSDISHAIETMARRGGYSVVRDFVGHGVGRDLHEEPQVPNYGSPGKGPVLRPGMTFCIEPMINLGDGAIEVLSDGWTAVTRDRQPSAHFEHMVAIREDGVEILTL